MFLVSEPLISADPISLVALQVLQQISTVSPLYIDYGSEEGVDGEVNALNLVKTLCSKVKSSKLDSKVSSSFSTLFICVSNCKFMPYTVRSLHLFWFKPITNPILGTKAPYAYMLTHDRDFSKIHLPDTRILRFPWLVYAIILSKIIFCFIWYHAFALSDAVVLVCYIMS